MKVEIKSNVKEVNFFYSSHNDNWRINVNGNPIQHRVTIHSYPVTLTFSSINKAVEAAKRRGLIPEDFDAKDLQQHILVCAKG